MLRTLTPQRSSRRGGFTLVEILVVVTIIAILVGITMVAVGRVRGKGDEVKVRADLTGLDTALGQFKAKFGRNVPCSGQGAPYTAASDPTPMKTHLNGTFRLCTTYTDQTWPEVAVLKALFPRIDLTTTPGGNGLLFQGNPVPSTNPILLDPNQCMVFFLSGGSFLEYLGFSTNPKQPFSATGNRLEGMPFFDFKKERMQKPSAWLVKHSPEIQTLPVPPSGFSGGNVFRWVGEPNLLSATPNPSDEPWFLDPWGTPYLCMTTGVSPGDYPFKDTPASATDGPTPVLVGPWGGSVSNFNLTPAPAILGPVAFKESANKWVNHATYQVVSGGPNGSQIDRNLSTPPVNPTRYWGFGPGGQVIFGKSDGYTAQQGGGDDFANFRTTALSATD